MQVGKQLLTIELNYFLNYFFTVFTFLSIWKESAISTCVLQFILYLLVKATAFISSIFFSPSQLTRLFLLFLFSLWRENSFNMPTSMYPAVAFSSLSSTERWEQRLGSLLNLFWFHFQYANIKRKHQVSFQNMGELCKHHEILIVFSFTGGCNLLCFTWCKITFIFLFLPLKK